MNSGVVLDASALLAYLFDEPGAEEVEGAMSGRAAISIVNWAEVLSKSAEKGANPQEVEGWFKAQGILGRSVKVTPVIRIDAMRIAQLRPLTRARGLSLGDRACLALGLRLKLPVLTAERRWEELELGVRLQVIR